MTRNEHKIPRKVVNEKDRFKLPPELLQRIALFIRDTSVFFAYLEAFHQDDGVLGNLEQLWTLSTVIVSHDRLWPSLHVHRAQVCRYKDLYMPVLAYFPTVHVFEVFDLEFLQQASMSSRLAMSGLPEEDRDCITVPLDAWYRTLPVLHISAVTYRNMTINAGILHLLHTLPHMPHLRALNLTRAIVPSFATLIDFIVSSQLTSINLTETYENPSWADAIITSAMDKGLTKWLKREPVVSVALGNWNLRDAATFFAALWSCTTLKELMLPRAKIPPLDAIPFGASPITISHVDLGVEYRSCHLRPEDVLALAQGIAHSTRLQILSLRCNRVGPVRVQDLMQAIVHSNVRELNLTECDLADIGCINVADCLNQTKLTTLDLGSNRITAIGAHELASAIATMPHLRMLSLRFNCLDASAVAVVVDAMGCHSRQAKLDVFQSTVADETEMDLAAIVARFPQLDVVLGW
ncbi:Aste57867_10229 [Aphanomyces stellatus]|uniref:Aste57867_10229 protein n=1 Tax=Aphanomyces stellatus TaxID=120398 RepID=A0A485KQH1_9STRA|nr:hypothetical protein As57867_010190 [Aphanomyces stellatus]VFT87104.1 Aste57867_10229 [Aphanomyces stellatus]